MFLETRLRSNGTAVSGFVWEQFDFEACDNNETKKLTWAVFMMLIFASGFPASAFILWEMFKTHRRGTPFTPNLFFITNLSVMDVVFLSFIPAGVLNIFLWKNWEFEATWNGFYALNVCGRPLLMACLCLDSYLAVLHPITYHQRKSLTPRVLMVGFVWAFTLGYGIVHFLFYKLYFSMFGISPFLVSLVVIAVCDSFIFSALLKSHPGNKNIHPKKQKAVQTLVNSLVISALTYLPPVLLVVIAKPLSADPKYFSCTYVFPLFISSSFGSAIMPILHLRNYGKLNFCFRLGNAGILNPQSST